MPFVVRFLLILQQETFGTIKNESGMYSETYPLRAQQMFNLVSSDGGILIVIFPGESYTGEANELRGSPPYSVDPQPLRIGLENLGFVALIFKKLDRNHTFPRRDGKEWIGIFQLTEEMIKKVRC